MEQGKEIRFPVEYDEHSNIWRAWEIWTREDFGSYTRKRVPSKPVGQLVITRDKNFYNKSRGFNDGYKYFWVDCKSGKKVKLTCEEFKERMFNYNNRQDCLNGGSFYIVKDAYTAIKAPEYVNKDTYMDYREYLSHYYPDYGREDCSVYVLWNKYDLPIVQIRAKAVGSEVEWDMAYPGDKEYTPLKGLTWLDLEYFARELCIVEQVHPAECFGFIVGFHQEKTYVRIGHTFFRTDIVPRGLDGRDILDGRFKLKHKYTP